MKGLRKILLNLSGVLQSYRKIQEKLKGIPIEENRCGRAVG